MEIFWARDSFSFLINLIVYPVALLPLLFWVFLWKEGRKNNALKHVMLLLLFSSIAAVSSSLQLIFSYIDVLLQLKPAVREFLFQLLSVVFIGGCLMFVSILPKALREINGRKDKPGRIEKALSILAYTASVVLSALFLLVLFPGLHVPGVLLSIMLSAAFFSIMLSFAHTLFIFIKERKYNPHFNSVITFLGGDIILLSLGMIMPPRLSRVFLSLFFLYHFFSLFVIFKKIWPKREHSYPKDNEKIRLFLEAGLSDRESEIALSLVKGLAYKEISDLYNISLSTVQTHTTRIYSKLGVNSKTALAAWFERS